MEERSAQKENVNKPTTAEDKPSSKTKQDHDETDKRVFCSPYARYMLIESEGGRGGWSGL
jgi:hypothetical protein